MTQDLKYIEKLVYKFKNGSINADELQTLTNWYTSHDDNEVTMRVPDGENHDQVKARILDGLLRKIKEDQSIHHPRYNVRKFYWIAAAAVLVVLVGTWASQVYLSKEPEQAVLSNRTIEPGGNKATLTLADGRQIDLSASQEGIVIDNGINYSDGTRLEDIGLFESADGKITQLALQTPRGGTYQATLPDGTRVWLNAASTLTYPTRFTDEQRIVELAGEAYFDVASAYRTNGSTIPFRVISKQQEIEVLGTQFNISAYADQPASKTTLVEGKIALKDRQRNVVLSPGDQATTTSSGTRVQQVDAGNYTAWRDGKFSFDGKSFAEVMTEIGRWYDLTIVYEGKVPQQELAGDAFRNQNIGLVLRLLDISEINYSLDVANRKLTIK